MTLRTPPASAHAPSWAPRAADGHPDLNGIWQALNEANWDLEMHMARPALQTRPGPYGPVPAPPVLALARVPGAPLEVPEVRNEWVSSDAG
mgnify:CR=1 FL=1